MPHSVSFIIYSSSSRLLSWWTFSQCLGSQKLSQSQWLRKMGPRLVLRLTRGKTFGNILNPLRFMLSSIKWDSSLLPRRVTVRTELNNVHQGPTQRKVLQILVLLSFPLFRNKSTFYFIFIKMFFIKVQLAYTSILASAV